MSRLTVWRITLGATAVAAGLALWGLGVPALEAGRFQSLKWKLAGGGGVLLALAMVAVFALSLSPAWPRVEARLRRAWAAAGRLGALNLLPALASAGLLSFLVYQPIANLFELRDLFSPLEVRIGLGWLCAATAAFFLRAALPKWSGLEALAGGLLLTGLLYRAAGFAPDVSNYPFSLGWSEGSRYYYASLFTAPRLYGLDLPWPFLHPTRYLMLSVPYLIPDLPLVAHRLWQVILWLGMPLLTGALMARRLPLSPRRRALAAGWVFLFLFMGPVYYHLLGCVVILLAGFDSRRLGRSLAVVALASAWAGISRVNWFPVPAMLAIALYLLETPTQTLSLVRYWWKPALWTATGLGAAFAAQAVYIALSRQPDAGSFGSSFTSDLLWNRLLPNPTYPPGILPMSLLLALPAAALTALAWARGARQPLRGLALAGMLAVLFAMGLVVSTKIGGGSNLHNLDAFFVLLALVALMVWARAEHRTPPVAALAALVFVLPFYPLLREGGPVPLRDFSRAQYELRELRNAVEPVAASGGRVLFIWQRQLLPMGLVRVPLQPEYETVDLMEMVMSGNRAYLSRWMDDLRSARFARIVVDRQTLHYKTETDAFIEEDDAWVRSVTVPLLHYYREVQLLDGDNIQILEPAPDPGPCVLDPAAPTVKALAAGCPPAREP